MVIYCWPGIRILLQAGWLIWMVSMLNSSLLYIVIVGVDAIIELLY